MSSSQGVRCARGPGGRGGAVGASGAQGVRVVTESADAQGSCALRCLARPGPALAGLNCKAWQAVFPQVGEALLLGEPIHFFFEKREVRPCYEDLLWALDCSGESICEEKERFWRCAV